MNISILVVVATYNRPNSLLAALRSIDNQDYENFSILISDNSTNTDTERIMENVYLKHRYRYVHREPQPNGIAHFNLILKEMPTDYDYYMICHDDDTLREGAISSVARIVEQHPSCVAICSNGYRVREDGTIICKFRNPTGDRVISSKQELGDIYIKGKGLPFPAILYKTETSHILFDYNKGGKYCDTSHTVDLLNMGGIYYASTNFILNYTISKIQDSKTLEPLHRRKLLVYLSQTCNIDFRSTIIKNFRLNDIYTYYTSNKKKLGNKLLFIFLYNSKYRLFYKSLLFNIKIWVVTTLYLPFC